HVGWLLCRKHPEVLEKGKTIDMSDLDRDPLIKFQRRFYIPLVALIWGAFPTFVPYYLWGESLWNSYFLCVMFRYALILNITWCVNSAAHLWGKKPYDKSINPVECVIRHVMFGEGFHNYHHTFPWDYSASELGAFDVFNPATMFIDFWAYFGQAYDLRKASDDVVKSRQKRSGDLNWKGSTKVFEITTCLATIGLMFASMGGNAGTEEFGESLAYERLSAESIGSETPDAVFRGQYSRTGYEEMFDELSDTPGISDKQGIFWEPKVRCSVTTMTQSTATETETGNNNNEIGFKNGTEIDAKPKPEYKLELVWRNIILMTIVHLSAIYGIYRGVFYAKPMTIYFMYLLGLLSSFGVQCGAHRLWCHRTYKAKLPLQILLAFMHILALENDIYETQSLAIETHTSNNNNEIGFKNGTEIDAKPKPEYKLELVWRNVILMIIVHLSGLYGLYLGMFFAKPTTVYFMFFVALLSSFGIQCGAHRLWCHRTYKAKLPLQILLAFMHILALENDIYEWSRDHRVHHKYSETDADPHNAKRGFFFAHVGWLLCRKHPEVLEKGKTIDMSDLDRDPLIKFQRRFYIPLVALIWGAFPTYVPYYLWGESLLNSYFLCVMFRYALTLNITWCVNSAAHLWGNKPYDKSINPVECTIRHVMFGEGFHNYHHTFPWDYSASEFGALDVFNPATMFIDFWAYFGQAYDLRKASDDVVKSRVKRSGDLGWKKSTKVFEILTAVATMSAMFSPFLISYAFRKVGLMQ
ncbi:unnamed protein product, partial [Oppiella nova]